MVKIPTRLEELIPAAAMERVLNALSQPDIPASVRDALGKLGWKDANPLGQVQEAWLQARSWLDSVVTSGGGKYAHTKSVLNGTGRLFTPELAGLPQPASVAYGYAKAASSFQFGQGVKAGAHTTAQSLFDRPTTWLSSPAVALRLLSMDEFASAGVVMSRADAVRVPGFGDVRAMLSSWGGQLHEIGASNGATTEDWERALKPQATALLVSPNNLSLDAANAQRSAAYEVARRVGARVVELLIDGVLSPAEGLSMPEVNKCLDEGADLVVFPTHLLLAGPRGVMLVGDESLVRGISAVASELGEEMSAAALAATTMAMQLTTLSQGAETGLPALLSASLANLKSRARRLAIQLNDTPHVAEAVEVERRVPLGPTPWDRHYLNNWGVRLRPRHSLEQLRRLLAGEEQGSQVQVPVIAHTEAGELVVDLRFIAPEDDHEIVIACGARVDAEVE